MYRHSTTSSTILAQTDTLVGGDADSSHRPLITLLEEAGRGGFGVVHRGYYKDRAGQVAVKIAKARNTEKDDDTDVKLREEAELLARAQHDCIVKFVAQCDISAIGTCIVMEWINGGNILQYLKAEKTAQRSLLLADIAGALAYLHNLNPAIVHGDIHTGNILVSDGRPVLIDFGLSHAAGLGEYVWSGNGRMDYLAPELLLYDSGTRTPASDVFAFGILIAEVYSGRAWGATYSQRLPALYLDIIRSVRPPKPEKIEDNVWALAQQCWAHKAVDRPAAEEVHSKLMIGM